MSPEPRSPLSSPTEQEGLWLASLESGRWSASEMLGYWTVLIDGDKVESESGGHYKGTEADCPEPIKAVAALHQLDWIDGRGQRTALGRRAYAAWLEAVQRPANLVPTIGGRWVGKLLDPENPNPTMLWQIESEEWDLVTLYRDSAHGWFLEIGDTEHGSVAQATLLPEDLQAAAVHVSQVERDRLLSDRPS